MKSYLELDQPGKAANYADKVLANSESDSEARNDARVIVARAAFASGNMSKAKSAYSEVQKTAKGEKGNGRNEKISSYFSATSRTPSIPLPPHPTC